ncbi:MAG: hypothetical protein IPL61_36135 [Myxococcales bacterium]|nr:hypothetical protein [Myxococcales bacterium]
MRAAALRALPLPARVLARLEAFDATWTAPVGDDALRALLGARGYEAHDAVLAFERAFGGLECEDPDDGPWLIGAAACAASDAHRAPRGGPGQRDLQLVPVIYTPNDGIGYVDARGAGWFHDTIEFADASQVADSGAALIDGIFCFDADADE